MYEELKELLTSIMEDSFALQFFRQIATPGKC